MSEEGGTLDTYIQNNAALADTELPTPSGCPDDYEEAGLDCAVTAATPLNTRVRLIVDELLDGSTVEEFFCACYDGPMTVQDDCPGGVYASVRAADCKDRVGTPVNEGGTFLDINADGVPDRAQILPGLMTITCGDFVVSTAPGAAGAVGNGFYNPSGNQQVPVGVIGGAIVPDVSKIGPAIVMTAPELPTSATCSISVATSGMFFAKDKDGLPMPALPTDATFTTAAFHALTSAPANMATGVALTVKPRVTFNANVKDDPATLAGVTLRVKATGVAVPGAASFVVSAAGVPSKTAVEFVPTAPLELNTEYELVVSTAVLTRLDDKPTAEAVFSFTTTDTVAP